MTKLQIQEKIKALKKVMEQNPDDIGILVHCGNQILDLETQLEEIQKPTIYLPPQNEYKF